jgi:ABC-type sugar transport system ATPase subunit
VAGLVGAGRTEVVRCIAGADHYDTGASNWRASRSRCGRRRRRSRPAS